MQFIRRMEHIQKARPEYELSFLFLSSQNFEELLLSKSPTLKIPWKKGAKPETRRLNNIRPYKDGFLFEAGRRTYFIRKSGEYTSVYEAKTKEVGSPSARILPPKSVKPKRSPVLSKVPTRKREPKKTTNLEKLGFSSQAQKSAYESEVKFLSKYYPKGQITRYLNEYLQFIDSSAGKIAEQLGIVKGKIKDSQITSAAVATISLIWKNFSYDESSIFVLESWPRKAFDCDTSSQVFMDIMLKLGVSPSKIEFAFVRPYGGDGHALPIIDGICYETTTGTKAMPEVVYYPDGNLKQEYAGVGLRAKHERMRWIFVFHAEQEYEKKHSLRNF